MREFERSAASTAKFTVELTQDEAESVVAELDGAVEGIEDLIAENAHLPDFNREVVDFAFAQLTRIAQHIVDSAARSGITIERVEQEERNLQ
jgi:hypothetical protein